MLLEQQSNYQIIEKIIEIKKLNQKKTLDVCVEFIKRMHQQKFSKEDKKKSLKNFQQVKLNLFNKIIL